MDRDGTVTDEIGYVNHPSRLRLLPRSGAAIRALASAHLPAVLITNQAGVARGYFTEAVLHETHDRLQKMLQAEGAHLASIYYCPHHPREGEPPYRADCDCRKPRPGLIQRAAAEHGYVLERCYMIGDKISDVAMAKQIGVTGILVMTGYGLGEHTYQRDSWKIQPDHIADDLFSAALWIIQQEKHRGAA